MIFQRKSCAIILLIAFALNVRMSGQDQSDLLRALDIGPALDRIEAKDILRDIKVLASDKLEGRNVGTRGEILTVDYLVDQFKGAGLEPGNPNSTYVQKVPLVGFRTSPHIDLSINGKKIPLQFLDDFIHEFPRLQPQVNVKNSEIVFAGYGIVVPEYDWDDYKAINVRDKLVILLGGEPSIRDKNDPNKSDAAFFRGDLRTFYSTMEFKKELALKKGAAAILFITDPTKSPSYAIFKTFALLEGFALQPQQHAKNGLASCGAY